MNNLNTNEKWVNIKNYSNYLVSNLGRVWSKKRKLFLSPRDCKGYEKVMLVDDMGVTKQLFIHRLVLLSFLGEDKERTICNHINGIPCDNRLSNLEWCNYSENARHAIKTGLRKVSDDYNFDITEADVIEIREEFVNFSGNIKDVADAYNMSYSQAYGIIKEKSWKNIDIA